MSSVRNTHFAAALDAATRGSLATWPGTRGSNGRAAGKSHGTPWFADQKTADVIRHPAPLLDLHQRLLAVRAQLPQLDEGETVLFGGAAGGAQAPHQQHDLPDEPVEHVTRLVRWDHLLLPSAARKRLADPRGEKHLLPDTSRDEVQGTRNLPKGAQKRFHARELGVGQPPPGKRVTRLINGFCGSYLQCPARETLRTQDRMKNK